MFAYTKINHQQLWK